MSITRSPADHPIPPDFEALVSRFLDGAAGDEDVARLDAILRADREACREFLRAAEQDASLREILPILEQRDAWVRRLPARGRRAGRPARSPGAAAWAWAAAAGLFAAFLLAAAVSRRTEAPEPVSSLPSAPRTPAPAPRAPDPPAPPPRLPRVPEDPPVPAPPTARIETPRPSPPPAPLVREETKPPPSPIPTPAPPEEPRPTRVDAPPRPSVELAGTEGGPESDAGGSWNARAAGRWTEGESVRAGRDVARLSLGDGTRLWLLPGTRVRLASAAPVQVSLDQGELTCEVTPGQGPRFSVLTPEAEARVLGTRFIVARDTASTRLEVDEGSVRLTRRRDSRSIDVRAGFRAAVGSGLALTAVPFRGPNLLVDPGFEARGRGWQFKGSSGYALAAGGARAGAGSLQISSSDQADPHAFQRHPVAEGASYEAIGWTRTKDVAGRTAIILEWETSGGAVIRVDLLGQAKGTQGWTRLAGRYVAPPTAQRLKFVVVLEPAPGDPGVGWFDDLHFGERK